MEVNAQLRQLKTLQRHFMGGVALRRGPSGAPSSLRPDKMQISARPANLSDASVRPKPIGGECGPCALERLEFSRVPRKSKSSPRASGEDCDRPAQEGSRERSCASGRAFVELNAPCAPDSHSAKAERAGSCGDRTLGRGLDRRTGPAKRLTDNAPMCHK